MRGGHFPYIQNGKVSERIKVHLVGARWSNFPWGMENEIFRSFEKMGYEVFDTDYRQQRGQFEELFLRDAHLMLVFKGSGISPELIQQVRCPAVLWYQDDIFTTEHGRRDIAYNASAFDVVYSFDLDALGEYCKQGVREVRWLPLAMSPAVHRKTYMPKKYDVSFVGNLFPNRKQLIERLQKRFDVFVTRAYMDEMVNIFNQSKIVLNLGIGPTGIQSRVFEALGCGAFLLTNEIPEGSRLFEDRKELVYFNEENIEDLIEYYLEHESEREGIALNGYMEVHAKHTYDHRVLQIVEDFFPQDDLREHHLSTLKPSLAPRKKRLVLSTQTSTGIRDTRSADHKSAKSFRDYPIDKDLISEIVKNRPVHMAEFLGISLEEVRERMSQAGELVRKEWRELSPLGVTHFYSDAKNYIFDLAGSGASGTSWRLEYLIRIIGPYLDKGSRFLDYGAGLGELGIYFSRYCDVTLLDVPGHTQNFAMFNAKKFDANIHFLNELSEDEEYDVISAQDVLEHIENAMETVRDISKALRPGGAFITSGFWFRPDGALHLDENIRFKDTFVEDFAQTGLVIENVFQGANWAIAIFEKVSEGSIKEQTIRYEPPTSMSLEEPVLVDSKRADDKELVNEL